MYIYIYFLPFVIIFSRPSLPSDLALVLGNDVHKIAQREREREGGNGTRHHVGARALPREGDARAELRKSFAIPVGWRESISDGLCDGVFAFLVVLRRRRGLSSTGAVRGRAVGRAITREMALFAPTRVVADNHLCSESLGDIRKVSSSTLSLCARVPFDCANALLGGAGVGGCVLCVCMRACARATGRPQSRRC